MACAEPPPALDESRTTYTAEFKAFLEQCLQMNPRKVGLLLLLLLLTRTQEHVHL
jgi:hypothetical protein